MSLKYIFCCNLLFIPLFLKSIWADSYRFNSFISTVHSILLRINHILLTHFPSDGQFFNDDHCCTHFPSDGQFFNDDHCCYFITQDIIYNNPITIVATINSTAVWNTCPYTNWCLCTLIPRSVSVVESHVYIYQVWPRASQVAQW